MKNKTHYLIDTETLDTRPTALVRCLSIAAFSLGAIETIEDVMARTLTVWFSIADQMQAGRTVDEDTIAFWTRQRDKYRPATPAWMNAHHILEGGPEDMPTREALEVIGAYHEDVGGDGRIFCRGGNFDHPIMETLYETMGVAFPFSTWDLRCSKSILDFSTLGDREVEDGLAGGLRSSHESAFDVAVEIVKLQSLFAVLDS